MKGKAVLKYAGNMPTSTKMMSSIIGVLLVNAVILPPTTMPFTPSTLGSVREDGGGVTVLTIAILPDLDEQLFASLLGPDVLAIAVLPDVEKNLKYIASSLH